MFALDTLVRSAVHAYIAILSPDIDIDPYPQIFKQHRPKPSTVDSNSSNKTPNSSQDKGNVLTSKIKKKCIVS